MAMAAEVQGFSERARELAPTINGLIQTRDNFAEQQIQVLAATLLEILHRKGFAYVEQVKPRFVGTMPCNIHYEMLDPLNVHVLLDLISGKGFDPSLPKGLAQEIGPNDEGHAIRMKNCELVARSGGLLSKIDAEELRIGACGASHTTSMLRLVDAAVGETIPSVAGCERISHNGFVSKSRVLERCPSLAQPVADGILYTIIRWQICAECPLLMETLSEAQNAEHDTFRKETTWQTMLNIHGKAKRLNAQTAEDWARVLIIVCRGHDQEFAQSAAHLCAFVQAYSGGDDPVFLRELDGYAKTLQSRRELPHVFFGTSRACAFPRLACTSSAW